jgi:hypothetical protein
MRWDFHGLTVEGQWNDAPLGERWLAAFAPRPRVDFQPAVIFNLTLADDVPPAPLVSPDERHHPSGLAYYVNGDTVTAHLPRFGQLRLDLAHSTTDGIIVSTTLTTASVLENVLMLGLAPHFRRRGLFPLRAFSATPPPLPSRPRPSPLPIRQHVNPHRPGVAVLLVGNSAGKTLAGLTLLHAGWKLLSTNAPLLALTPNANSPTILAYPGLLAAHPDTLMQFPELKPLAASRSGGEKIFFAPDSVYPNVWIDSAPPALLVFPHVEARPDHALELLPVSEVLHLLLPHALERWDRETQPAQLTLLTQLVETVPAYRLHLGPDVNTLPALLLDTIDRRK